MILRRLLAIAVLHLASGWAHACLFATSTPPQGWYEWSAALLAGDVTALEKDAQKSVDVVIVKVVETFKGPDAARGTLTVRLSSRYWSNCKVEMPAVGARVLVATNANSDAMLVPLSASYAEQLRA
ncbi:MAG TPA: hypothetical protein VNP36_06460, partial [Burkholderiales bacterium]|nr:hypothetical protein [Burkholderiales bacterium]